MRGMRTELRQPRRDHLLKRPFSHPAANLIDLLADHPKHDSGRSRIIVRVNRPYRAIGHRPFVPAVVAGSEPMDSFRGLHQSKLLDAMTAMIVFDERGDSRVDRQESFRLDARFTKPCEGHARL